MREIKGMSTNDAKLTEREIHDMLMHLGIKKPTDKQIQDTINRMNIKITTDQQIRDMADNIKVAPDKQQVESMQRRMGIIPTGDFEQTKKDVDEILRLRPKTAQTLLGMTKDDYTLFGVEPSPNL